MAQLTLFGLIQFIGASCFLLRKYGSYLKSLKPEGNKDRPILRWWETMLFTISAGLWWFLMFRLVFLSFRDTAANAATAVMIALGITSVTPIISPPFLFISLLAFLIHGERKRKMAVQNPEENSTKQ